MVVVLSSPACGSRTFQALLHSLPREASKKTGHAYQQKQNKTKQDRTRPIEIAADGPFGINR